MYARLVFTACLLAFCAVVFSAYARLTDAGLGCSNWPACYEENALKQRQPPQADTLRKHESWQWKLQNLVGLLLGILSFTICGQAWKKRRTLQQSPFLPTMLVVLMAFLGIFGILAFSYLPRAVIVPIHLAGGIATLILLTWIALRQTTFVGHVNTATVRRWRLFSRLCLILLLIQIMLGGWVSSNFAALACTGFPLCKGSLLPAMDFSYSLDRFGMPLAMEKLTAIHWLHRLGALILLPCIIRLSIGVMAESGLRTVARTILALIVFQFLLGITNVLLGLPLPGVVLHNAVAMLLVVMMVVLNYRLRNH